MSHYRFVSVTSTIGQSPVAFTPTRTCRETWAKLVRVFGGKRGQDTVAYVTPSKYDEISTRRWALDHKGYARATSGKYALMHRFILGKAVEGMDGDHIDRYPLNNRDSNLRPSTRQQNTWNRSGVKGRDTYKGVCWIKRTKKYRSSIGFNGIAVALGEYDDSVQAAKLYDACARYHFGEFAATNFEGTEKLNAFEVREAYLKDKKLTHKSAYIGVTKATNNGLYAVYFRQGETKGYVQTFDCEITAARVHDALARFYRGADTLTNFPGDETMSIGEARVYCRRLAFEAGRCASQYLNVQKVSSFVANGNSWYATVRRDYGKWKILDKTFPTEIEAARAVDEALSGVGLPRVNFL